MQSVLEGSLRGEGGGRGVEEEEVEVKVKEEAGRDGVLNRTDLDEGALETGGRSRVDGEAMFIAPALAGAALEELEVAVTVEVEVAVAEEEEEEEEEEGVLTGPVFFALLGVNAASGKTMPVLLFASSFTIHLCDPCPAGCLSFSAISRILFFI